jgi:F-box and WD-40 domain protein 1/11
MANHLNMRDPAAPSYFAQSTQFKNPNLFRLDEGYSEETRSQAGSEMIRSDEARFGGGMEDEEVQGMVLPEWMGSLGETERSGRFSSACAWCLRCCMVEDEEGVVLAVV